MPDTTIGIDQAIDGPFPGHDQRNDPRFALLMRPAKIIATTGEYICVLRDVSANGIKLRLFHPLPFEKQMRIELGNGDRYDIARVWEREDQAGFSFVQPVSITHLINEPSPFPKRSLRVRLELPVLIDQRGAKIPAVLRDISMNGARIECETQLALRQRVQLAMPDGPLSIDAKVRWRRKSAAGLVFEQTFRLDQLARLAARLQPFAGEVSEIDIGLCQVRLAR